MSTGKSREDFPGAYIPFDKAVGPVPTVPIDSAPTVQLCLNESWLPFVIGCLKALARPETWDDTYDHSVVAASEFAALLSRVSDGCGVVVPSFMCASGSFADDLYGFVPAPGSPCVATWVDGTGWEMCADSTPQGFLDIKREFGVDTVIRSVYLKITTTLPYLIDYDVTIYDNGDFVSVAHDTAVGGPTIIVDVGGLTQPGSAMFIHIVETLGGAAAAAVISDWKLCYTGAFPLSIAPAGILVCTYVQVGSVVEGSGPASVSTDGTIYTFSCGPSDPANDNDYSFALRVSGCSHVTITGLSGYTHPHNTSHYWSGYDNCAGTDSFFTSNVWPAVTTRQSKLVYLRSETPFTLSLQFT